MITLGGVTAGSGRFGHKFQPIGINWDKGCQLVGHSAPETQKQGSNLLGWN